MPAVIPLIKLLMALVPAWFLGRDGQPALALSRRGAVRLSALRQLAPGDPVCDTRGRESKFCLRELQMLREPQGGSGRGDSSAMSAGLFEDYSPLRMGADSNAVSSAAADVSPSCPKDQLPHCDKEFLEAGVRVIRDEECLNVPQSVVADGFMSQEECDVLIKFGLAGTVENGRMMYSKPLTDKEVFTGYQAADVIEHLRSSAEMATATRVTLAASDRARLFTEAYFRLRRRLYMHLVQTACRRALNNSSTERRDMSHPLHADNCQFQENASCPALTKEFIWRDFSAVIFLNDDAHGGEFVFTKAPRTSVRGIVRPKCGRLVAFNGSNCHGVLPVFTGRRCSLLVWMTHTEKQQEPWRNECSDILGYTVANSSDRFFAGF